MKQIPLTQGKFALVDSEDYEMLSQFKWYCNKGYAARNVKYGTVYRVGWLHRMLLSPDPKEEVDHINHDTLDNRRSNLRICAHQENLCNQKSVRGSSAYKGVYWHKSTRKWAAQLKFHQYQLYLGRHDTEYDAACAYDAAAKWLFESFAEPNF